MFGLLEISNISNRTSVGILKFKIICKVLIKSATFEITVNMIVLKEKLLFQYFPVFLASKFSTLKVLDRSFPD